MVTPQSLGNYKWVLVLHSHAQRSSGASSSVQHWGGWPEYGELSWVQCLDRGADPTQAGALLCPCEDALAWDTVRVPPVVHRADLRFHTPVRFVETNHRHSSTDLRLRTKILGGLSIHSSEGNSPVGWNRENSKSYCSAIDHSDDTLYLLLIAALFE